MFRFLFLCMAGTSLALFGKEIITFSLPPPSSSLKDLSIKTISIFAPDSPHFEIGKMVKKLLENKKAELEITGKTDLVGSAMRADLTIWISIPKEYAVGEKYTYLYFDKTTPGLCSRASPSDKAPLSGLISLGGKTVVFSDATTKEVSDTIQVYLQESLDNITLHSQETIKVFVVEPPLKTTKEPKN